MSPNEVVLTLPRERAFHDVAHLVLGGLGARLDLTYGVLEDVQLALSALLGRGAGAADGDVTIALAPGEGALHTRVGPFREEALRAELTRAPGNDLSLRRVLESVCDRITVEDGEGGFWVELSKTLEQRDEAA